LKYMYWELLAMVELCALGAIGIFRITTDVSTESLMFWSALTSSTFFGGGMILMDVIKHFDANCNEIETTDKW